MSTRSVDVWARRSGSGVSKSRVSRSAAKSTGVGAFLARPLEGALPFLWTDATYRKVRQNRGIVSVAVIVAVGVNADGRREVPVSTSVHRTPSPSGPPLRKEPERPVASGRRSDLRCVDPSGRGYAGARLLPCGSHAGAPTAPQKALEWTE
jgi:hypothetical protein